jgi:hypothetical protein
MHLRLDAAPAVGNGGAKLCQGSGMMVALRAKENSASLALSRDREGGGIFSVDLYRKVRLACRDGMSERAAARHFGTSSPLKNASCLRGGDLGWVVPLDDCGDGAQDVCGEMGCAEEQARQKAPEPGQKLECAPVVGQAQAAVLTGVRVL